MKWFVLILVLLSNAAFGQHKRLDIIKDYPVIPDTTELIRTIINSYNLEVDCMAVKKVFNADFLTRYTKIEIAGSPEPIILLEYDYGDGCGAAFPYKFQLYFRLTGELIDITQFVEFELLKVFPKEKSYIKGLLATYKGNGGYGLYKIVNGKMMNLIEPKKGYYSRTYDAHADEDINEPYGLKMTIRDTNEDEVVDLVFSGKKHYWLFDTEESGKYTMDIEYIYLFDSKTGKFKEKENYHEIFVKRKEEELEKLKK